MQIKQIVAEDHCLAVKITGVNLAEVPSSQTAREIEEILERYGVLVFPDQHLSPDEQINFSRVFGDLEEGNTVSAAVNGFPELAEIGNVGNRPVSFAPSNPDGELEWHTDHIQHQTPSKYTVLYAKEVPPQGGDTLFACMYEAYDALDPKEKTRCDNAVAIHSASGLRQYLARQGEFDVGNVKLHGEDDKVSWPLVRRHPLSGRKSLYFAAALTVGIEGWSEDDALMLIKQLTLHSTQEQFVYQHQWQPGQVVMWDNRRLLHTGTWYDKDVYRRYLLRTMIKEDMPIEG